MSEESKAQDDDPTRFGCVAMFDVLGVRGLDLKRARTLMDKMDKVVDDHSQNITTQLRAGEPIFQVRPAAKEMLFLGDTFIALYPTKSNEIDKLAFLTCCSFYATQFFLSLLYQGILVRGAMSMGYYLKSATGQSAIGPAIFDAISWCEKSDWMGLNLTPLCGLLFDQMQTVDKFPFGYTKYEMPLSKKEKAQKDVFVWCSAWPRIMTDSIGEDPRHPELTRATLAKTHVIELLRENQSIPFGVESKYFNTLTFFDHCLSQDPNK